MGRSQSAADYTLWYERGLSEWLIIIIFACDVSLVNDNIIIITNYT